LDGGFGKDFGKGSESAAMESPLLGLILDSSEIIAAEIAGQISGEQAAKGITLPADDLLIGASAIEQGYAVATLNTRHFAKIPGLQVLAPWNQTVS